MDLGAEILKVVATAALAASSTWGFGYLVDRKPKAVHLAIKVATTLERFAIDCLDAAQQNDMFLDSSGVAGTLAALPEFPDYPADAAWSFLDKGLAERALTLPNRRRYSVGLIQFEAEEQDNPQDPEPSAAATLRECGRMGLAAWTLAGDIRRKYGLPQVAPKTLGYDVARSLKPHADAADADDKMRRGD